MPPAPWPTVRLNDGNSFPFLGFGTFRLTEKPEVQTSLETALACGYRHFDTAPAYQNERLVGEILHHSGVPRSEFYITTKLSSPHASPQQVMESVHQSITDLQCGYLDLYLIHWPADDAVTRIWETFEKLEREGLCRSIGVCNFSISRLKKFLPAFSVTPAINQVEFNPFCYQQELHNYCREKGIQLQAYRSLVFGKRLSHPAVTAIATAHAKNPAQVLLRWALQHDVMIIPKSATPERIMENCALFDFSLTPEEMQQLNALDENLHAGWYPQNWY